MRQREQSFDLNTYFKDKVITSNKIEKDGAKKKENYKVQNDYVNSNITKKEFPANEPSRNMHFHPKYMKESKELKYQRKSQ